MVWEIVLVVFVCVMLFVNGFLWGDIKWLRKMQRVLRDLDTECENLSRQETASEYQAGQVDGKLKALQQLLRENSGFFF